MRHKIETRVTDGERKYNSNKNNNNDNISNNENNSNKTHNHMEKKAAHEGIQCDTQKWG